MNNVGTVIREVHEGGYSIWVLVHRALCQGYGDRQQVWRNPEWLCIESTATGNCGARFAESERPTGGVIGSVPGTAAALASTQADAADKSVHWCSPDCVDPDTWDESCPLNAGVSRPGGVS